MPQSQPNPSKCWTKRTLHEEHDVIDIFAQLLDLVCNAHSPAQSGQRQKSKPHQSRHMCHF
jgi:hypothetical protein